MINEGSFLNAYIMNRNSFNLSKGHWNVIVTAKRRWRVRPGDVFVFFDGFANRLNFDSVGRVSRVDVERVEVEERNRTYLAFKHNVRVSEPISLPSNRNLNAFMFSLRRVYNFSRPWLHFRHRSILSNEDLGTILSGRIHTRRSLFYGLLRHLPRDWRQFYEHQSYALSTRADHRDDLEEFPPVDHLLKLLRETIFQTVTLATSVQSGRQQLGIPGLSRIVAASDDESVPGWSAERLLRKAPELSEKIEQGTVIITELVHGSRWTAVSDPVELPAIDAELLDDPALFEDDKDEPFLDDIASRRLITEGKELKWPPHRW